MTLAGRIALVVTTLAGLLLLTFAMGRLLPADPVLAAAGQEVDRATYDRIYREMGLDQPVHVQFLRYLGRVAQGDLGSSLITGRSVAGDLARAVPATVELAVVATLVAVLLGVPLGMVAAWHRDRLTDHAVRLVSLVGYSTPVFMTGLFVILVFYGWLDIIPPGGRLSVYYEGLEPVITGFVLIDAALVGDAALWRDAAAHLVAPSLVLGLAATAFLTRMVRSFMLDQIGQEYVMTARAKGLSDFRVVVRHILPNIQVQLITVVVLTFGGLMEGAVIVETVFAWPGLGSYLTRGLQINDLNVVLGSVLFIGVVFVLLNQFADILYRIADPPGAGMTGIRVSGGAAGGLRLILGNPSGALGLAIVAAAVLAAVLAPWVAAHDPAAQDMALRLQGPSAAHPLGTDAFGRDQLSRLIHGARSSLYIVALVTLVSAPLGLILGAVSGYLGGWTDAVLMRVTDVFLALPGLILALGLAAALGPGLNNAALAIAFTAWPNIARLARAEALVVRQADYILAVRLAGAGWPRIVLRHVLPMCLPSVIVRATVQMAAVLLTAASLGFLGLGAKPPTPEWGSMVASGREFMFTDPGVVLVPGIAIAVLCLGFNLLGDLLRDSFDPQGRP